MFERILKKKEDTYVEKHGLMGNRTIIIYTI